MKDLITQARAVEARLRELEYEMQEEAADTISSLCTALEAAQRYKLLADAAALSIEELLVELEAAQKDAERYRWLKNRIEVRKQAAVNGSVRDSISVRIGYAFIDATTRTFPKEYEVEISAKLDQAVDAAIKAQGDADENA